MSKRNPRYIEQGLTVELAMVVAQFLGWQYALANAITSGKLCKTIAKEIAAAAEFNVHTLMTDGTLDKGTPSELAIDTNNPTFEVMADFLARSIAYISEDLEACKSETTNEGAEDVTAD